MISLDTNVVLRLILGDIPSQERKVVKLITSETVYVTDAIVIETIYVLEKTIGLRRDEVSALLRGFLSLDAVEHNQAFLERAIETYGRHPSLSIVDCYAAAEAEYYGNELITFDRALAHQGGTHVRLL